MTQLAVQYLKSVQDSSCCAQGLSQLEGLVTKVADVLHSRADSNLRAVQATCLVDLPPERTFAADEFASHQSGFTKRQTERLSIRFACFLCAHERVQKKCPACVAGTWMYGAQNWSVAVKPVLPVAW